MCRSSGRDRSMQSSEVGTTAGLARRKVGHRHHRAGDGKASGFRQLAPSTQRKQTRGGYPAAVVLHLRVKMPDLIPRQFDTSPFCQSSFVLLFRVSFPSMPCSWLRKEAKTVFGGIACNKSAKWEAASSKSQRSKPKHQQIREPGRLFHGCVDAVLICGIYFQRINLDIGKPALQPRDLVLGVARIGVIYD